MALDVGPLEGDAEELVAAINTTPLVDVMLVLMIIFLITIPVVTATVPVSLPKERNQPTQTRPENVVIAVTRDGDVFWNDQPVVGERTLAERLKALAQEEPQPEVHVRGDEQGRYESVGRVVAACKRAGILQIGFIIQPPVGGG